MEKRCCEPEINVIIQAQWHVLTQKNKCQNLQDATVLVHIRKTEAMWLKKIHHWWTESILDKILIYTTTTAHSAAQQ